VAAMSVSARVAQEMGVKLGNEVKSHVQIRKASLSQCILLLKYQNSVVLELFNFVSKFLSSDFAEDCGAKKFAFYKSACFTILNLNSGLQQDIYMYIFVIEDSEHDNSDVKFQDHTG
jgi:hypothetical protein